MKGLVPSVTGTSWYPSTTFSSGGYLNKDFELDAEALDAVVLGGLVGVLVWPSSSDGNIATAIATKALIRIRIWDFLVGRK